ncbi:hypothetical protein ACH5RR_003016 [Cinchona calisaya]|uniref:Uncharacterized protein n=1 Tax=Cinchona calisaya TaxID=153742 RepID=A0ABD3ATM1_9GENT
MGNKGKIPLNEGVVQGGRFSITQSKPFMMRSHGGNRSTSWPQHVTKDMDTLPMISGSKFASFDLELEDEENHGKFSQLEREVYQDNIPLVSVGIDINAVKKKIRVIPPPKIVFLEKP